MMSLPYLSKEHYHQQFGSHCETNYRVFVERNKDYGNAFISTGVLGASVALIGDISRLRSLVLEGEMPKTAEGMRQLQDVFRDIHNYANFGSMMLAERNWSGRGTRAQAILELEEEWEQAKAELRKVIAEAPAPARSLLYKFWPILKEDPDVES